VSVQAIDTALVMKVLEPLWTVRPETASRLRGRIESVLSWATVRGYRTGPNPAQWRGHLDHLLAARAKVARVEHHAAMPHAEVAGLMRDLRRQDGIVAGRALEFLVLTATRVGEVIGARWTEIDLAKRIWTIPPERMKAQREHRVPLSPPALEILKALPREGDLVFTNGRDRALSNKAMLRLLVKRMARPVTVHGFRSSFRVWCAEQTNFPSEVAEAALAHVVSNKVIEAYRRTDFFDRRRRLMDEWARFLATPAPAKADKKVVVSLRTG
jgi:integrase